VVINVLAKWQCSGVGRTEILVYAKSVRLTVQFRANIQPERDMSAHRNKI
jgi:hypothetical protein